MSGHFYVLDDKHINILRNTRSCATGDGLIELALPCDKSQRIGTMCLGRIGVEGSNNAVTKAGSEHKLSHRWTGVVGYACEFAP
jgi:hypothetical protein